MRRFRSSGGLRRATTRGTVTAVAVLAGALAYIAPASATHEARSLQVTPEIQRTFGGKTTTLRASIDPAAGADGVAIDFEIVTGPNARMDGNAANTPQSPDLDCEIAEGDSSCSVSYQGRKRSGRDRVMAWIDHDEDDSTTEADAAEKPDTGGPPEEPGCPVAECGPSDTSGEGDSPEPDSTDVVLSLWGQMKAGHVAIQDGPIDFRTKGCDSVKDRNARGRVIATAKACTFVFTVDPSDDLSDERDFGSLWIQSQVDARKNWCIDKVKTEIRVPDGARLEGVTQKGKMTNKRRKLARANLRIGEPGQMATSGLLKNLFYVYPGEMFRRTRDGGDRQMLIWKGSTRKPQGFALGLSISWLEDDGLPDFSSSGGALKRFVVKKRACIPGQVG